METQVFEERLKKLSAITGEWENSDAWSSEYEAILNEVKEDTDQARRYAQADRLRRLLDHQLEFMMNSWVAESRKARDELRPGGEVSLPGRRSINRAGSHACMK